MNTTLIELYTKSELMKAFGTLTPTLRQRTKYFDKLWFEFGKENELNMYELNGPDNNPTSEVIAMIRRQYGVFNVARRGMRLRFRNQEDAVFVRLAYS